MRKRNVKGGFTLIELSLSIAFIAVLSLAVVLIIANSISAYHRGMVLNQVNTTGMELVDDTRAAVQNAQAASLKALCSERFVKDNGSVDTDKVNDCEASDGAMLTSVRRYATIWVNKDDPDSKKDDVPVYGTFCTGNYSYIWNTGYFQKREISTGNFKGFNEDSKVQDGVEMASVKYINSTGGAEASGFKILKIKDEKRMVCVAAYNATERSNPSSVFDITKENDYIITEEPVELLPRDGNLALYDLYAPAPAVNAMNNNMYYFVSFVLGTLRGGADIKTDSNYCVTPEGVDNASIENFDYCAINKFNFAAEAIGGGK